MSQNEFYELLKTIAPLLVILLIFYVVINKWYDLMKTNSQLEYQRTMKSYIVPNRIQAYERMVLFLERNAPQQLTQRIPPGQISAMDYQSMLIQEINQEFNHNLSQQIYMSDKSWNAVKLAKENLIQDVMISYSSLPNDAKAKDLAVKILNQAVTNKDVGDIDQTVKLLKSELNKSIY